MTRTVDAAFEAVREGDGPHSLYTTLAPVYDALMADAGEHYDDQAWLVNAELPGDAGRVIEVGCGLGGLLARIEGERELVVGLDRHRDLLSFARDRTTAPLVRGDATALPAAGAFDACVALEYVTADLHGDRADRAFASMHDALVPGGRLLVDAVAEPKAVMDDPWSGTRSRYRIDRTVEAGDLERDRAVMGVHYELTDEETGETVETHVDRTVRLFDADGLAAALESAGFVDVEVTRKLGDEGALLATATRPSE